MQRLYGLTPEQLSALLGKQNHKCAICKGQFKIRLLKMKGKRLCARSTAKIDHSHKTGKVRGILCDSCNRGLGYFHDSPVVLQQAIAYLLP